MGDLNTTDIPAPNFNTKDQSFKNDWLRKHGLPSKPSVSLYDCYHQGAKITHIFKVISLFVTYMKGKVNPAASTAMKWLKKLIEAFNMGIWRLAQSIARDCEYLMAHGKYDEEGVPMEPIELPKVELVGKTAVSDQVIDHPEPIACDAQEIDIALTQQALWDSIAEALQVFIASYKGLNKIIPMLNVSYTEILVSFLVAGKNLMGTIEGTENGEFKRAAEPSGALSSAAFVQNDGVKGSLKQDAGNYVDPVREPEVSHYPGYGC
ncbi:hypothetical protein MMC11_002327 [Xylographa trunciseda]|nr:hypothetical protein [Xylographa trunciseda]